MLPRVKVFMWLTLRGVIPTKDNLIQRDWCGDSKCSFCGREENINHLFFHCFVGRMLWMVMKCAFNMHDIPDNIQQMLGIWILFLTKMIEILW